MRAYICMHRRTPIYMYIYIYIYICIRVHVDLHTYSPIGAHACARACLYVYTHICMDTCMYMHVCANAYSIGSQDIHYMCMWFMFTLFCVAKRRFSGRTTSASFGSPCGEGP